MTRARNLDDADIEKIVGVLDGWSGRLTWEQFIDAVERRIHARYTRQALYMHARIRDAFARRKDVLSRTSGKRKVASSPELQAALDRAARLAAENDRLKAENGRLLEQFLRWSYNANTRGLDDAYLNQPLPPVDRQQSKKSGLQKPKLVMKD